MKNKIKVAILVFSLIFTSILFISCNKEQTKDLQTDKVAVSIIPQRTFLKNIVKDELEILTLIPSGSSPASYQPSPKTLEKLENSSIYFSIGVPTEKANIIPFIKDNENLKIVDLAKRVDEKYEPNYLDNDKKARDPHIWLSVKRAIVIVDEMKNELIKKYPEKETVFTKNANEYINKLKNLDEYITNKSNKLESNSFIIFHPSYGYYSNEYNLNMVPLEIGGKKASIKRLQKIINFAKEKNINTFFYQEEMSKKQIDLISKELDGKVVKLKPLGKDYIQNQKILIDTLAGE
ncbi:MAG: metal ABC transporter solute-binding protein, Zn/Mn family [Bacillota bacterium]